MALLTKVMLAIRTTSNSLELPLAARCSTYYGPTYYGPTYYGPTYYGPTYYGSTYYGSTYYGPTYCGPTYYGPTYYGPTYYGSTYELPLTSRGAMLLPPSYMELLVTQVGST